jgi:hypothetical protein
MCSAKISNKLLTLLLIIIYEPLKQTNRKSQNSTAGIYERGEKKHIAAGQVSI